VHITELGTKLRVDTEGHDSKHTRNISDIENLRKEIQELKAEMNQRENEHLKMVE
jgi:hypothetical protein